jgi:Leu/Phe-tRNA-protein transferase
MPVRHYPDWESFDIAPDASDSPVAFCADLSPASVLGAYRRGIIPFPAPDEHFRTINEFRYEDQVAHGTIGLVGREAGRAGGWGDDPYWVAWWSPDPRPVIGVGQVHLGRNVRKQLRRGNAWTTVNTIFPQVAEECRAGRGPRWLTDALLRSLIELHQAGWAHSIEVWLDGDLIGGGWGSASTGSSAEIPCSAGIPARRGSRSRTWPRDWLWPVACSSMRSGTALSCGRSAPCRCRESATCRCSGPRRNGWRFPLSRSPRGGWPRRTGRTAARQSRPDGIW